MAEYKHWCGNCQIKVYMERHYGLRLNWQNCPYACDYATAMRCSVKPSQREVDIDADALNVRAHSESYFGYDFASEWVDDAPTIIEAEGVDDD